MTLDGCVCIKDRISMHIFSTILDEHLLTTYGPQPARQKNLACSAVNKYRLHGRGEQSAQSVIGCGTVNMTTTDNTPRIITICLLYTSDAADE